MDLLETNKGCQFNERKQNQLFIEQVIINAFGNNGEYLYKSLVSGSILFPQNQQAITSSLFAYKLLMQTLNKGNKLESVKVLINFLTDYEVIFGTEGIWFESYQLGYTSLSTKQVKVLEELGNVKKLLELDLLYQEASQLDKDCRDIRNISGSGVTVGVAIQLFNNISVVSEQFQITSVIFIIIGILGIIGSTLAIEIYQKQKKAINKRSFQIKQIQN